MNAVLVFSLALVATVGAQAPSYAPYTVACPSNLVRDTGSPLAGTQTVDPNEAQYTTTRRTNVLQGLWTSYLGDNSTGATGYNLPFTNTSLIPRVGIANSGGGYRSAQNSAGMLSAMDSRNASNVGPFLQLADYMTGLSGGSWITSSLSSASQLFDDFMTSIRGSSLTLVVNDLPDLYSLVLGDGTRAGWLLEYDLVSPAQSANVGDDALYYAAIESDVSKKVLAGYSTSIVDVWGRALSYHFWNQTNRANFFQPTPHDQGLIWSSIRFTQNFQNNAMPLPIVLSTSRVPTQTNPSVGTTVVIPLKNTVFEWNPFSWGSYDPSLASTMTVDYAGSVLVSGNPTGQCVNGYENAGFVIGTSAGLFNAIAGVVGADALNTALNVFNGLLGAINPSLDTSTLEAVWPNSFRGLKAGAFAQSADQDLLLTDGGENGENVPLNPLLVKARAVDFILALDGSADTSQNFPNGTSLLFTRDRVNTVYPANYVNFPPIPASADVFISQGLNQRPTFFGCNMTGSGDTSQAGQYPLIAYIPNRQVPGMYNTGQSTFKLSYSRNDTLAFLDASHANAVIGYPNADGSKDPNYPLALKCAAVDRARQRAGLARSSQCEQVLAKYCWS